MSDGPDLHVWSALLRSSVERLTDPPETQIAYLRELDLGDLADELALEFDDGFRPVAPLLQGIPEAQALLSALLRIDSALKNQDLEWRADALTSSSAWAEIRRLASAALDEQWPE